MEEQNEKHKEDEVSNDDLDSLKSFTDDSEVENDRTFYQQFDNASNSIDEILKEEYDKSMGDIEKLSNLCETSEEEREIDDFTNTEKRIDKFKETLLPVPGSENDNCNSFVNAIFYAVRFNNKQKTEFCNSVTLKESIDSNLFIQLNQEKFNISLDYQKFNSQCHEINMTLAKYGYFLRVFELKSKLRHLALKNPKKQNIVRQLSICINKKYNGFHVISIEYSKKLRTKFKPINIIYEPIKSPEKEVLCFSANDISKSYRNSCGATSDKVSHGFVFECYYFGKFFAGADKQKRHTEKCSGVPGIIYNFSNKNLITFEDNFKSKGDIPMVIYFDFETTAPEDNCFNPKQKKAFFIFYVLIVAFHLHLKLRKIIIQRSYGRTLQQLTTLDYLTNIK